MRNPTRTRIAAVFATGALSLAGAGTASAATQQDGLVNVNVSDVTVQVPIAIAANVCDTTINALSEQLALGDTDCDAVSQSDASAPGGGGGGDTKQQGLVNVNLDDIIVQVPVSVAANICDTSVNLLARQIEDNAVNCDAFAESGADA